MGDRQNQRLSWFAGKIRCDRDESRKNRRPERPKHRRNQRLTYNSPESMDRDSTQQKLTGSGELASSSSEGSLTSIPSDDVASRIRVLATKVSSEDDRSLLEEVEQYIEDQDREMKKLVTTIAKMYRADTQKRDETYFVKQTKTLRIEIENWSKTQTSFGPGSKADAKTELLRLSSNPSSSGFFEIFKSTGLNISRYFAMGGDVSRLLQAYMWAIIEREVFSKSRWAGDTKTFVVLKAAVVPRKCRLQVLPRMQTLTY